MTNFCVCAFLILLVTGKLVDAQVCTYTDTATGVTYDLTPFKRTTTDWQVVITTTTPPTTYYMNFCAQTITQICGSGVACCQSWDPTKGGFASVGTAASQKLTTNTGGQGGYGVTASYSGGDATRNYEVDFLCNPNAGLGAPTFTKESPTYHYMFEWQTSQVCPGNVPINPPDDSSSGGGLSGGSVFCILLLCATCVYIIGGVAFNKLYRKTEGFVDTFPNWIFWISLPSLVKDGGFFLVHKVRGQ